VWGIMCVRGDALALRFRRPLTIGMPAILLIEIQLHVSAVRYAHANASISFPRQTVGLDAARPFLVWPVVLLIIHLLFPVSSSTCLILDE
jgi:hypothetical protein